MYTNLSSQTLFSTLDDLIYTALSTLMDTTTFVEQRITDLVNFQYYNKRRDVSTKYKWGDAIHYCLEFVRNPTEENLRDCYLDRGYLIPILSDFLEKTNKYSIYYIRGLKNKQRYFTKYNFYIESMHNQVGAKQELFQTILQVKYLLSLITEHKHLMIEAYKLYYMKIAHMGAKSIPLPIDIEELIQNYYLATSKAIDHFDLSKGAFKSYLDQWLKKVLHSGSHFYGSAYNTANTKNLNHLYVPIDSIQDRPGHESPEQALLKRDENIELKTIVKMFDPDGITSFSQ